MKGGIALVDSVSLLLVGWTTGATNVTVHGDESAGRIAHHGDGLLKIHLNFWNKLLNP